MALARNDVSVALLAACLPLPSFCLVLVKSTAGFVALRLVPMVEKKKGAQAGSEVRASIHELHAPRIGTATPPPAMVSRGCPVGRELYTL